MELYVSLMVGMEPPKSTEDSGRWRVVSGDAKESHHIGWVDEDGFYVKSSEGKLVRLSPEHLIGIESNIYLIRKVKNQQTKNTTD